MELLQEIRAFLGRLANFAETVQRRIAWFLLLGLVASIAFAWQFYSPDSANWWNAVKCGLVMLPVLVWSGVWLLLGQLREAPQLAINLADNQELSFTQLQAKMAEPKMGLVTLLGTVKELRDNDAFETVTDTIGSFTLLVNPLFLILAFAMLVILFMLILISPVLLFF